MKEFNDILKAYDNLDKTTTKVVLATVIDVKGSSYRRTGARMLILDNGIWTGGISGGCLEGDVLKKAYLVMSTNKAAQITYDTAADKEQIGASLGCNGIIDILLAPVDYADTSNPVEQLRKQVNNRSASVIITVIEAGNNLSIKAGQVLGGKTEYQHLPGDVPQGVIEEVFAAQKSSLQTYNDSKLFFEFVPPPVQLVVLGGNYDVYPLLKIASQLGWHNIIVTNPKKLAAGTHRLADEVVDNYDLIAIDDFTVAVLMSHDINTDLKNLQKVLKSTVKYIGMLGPASRKTDIIAKLPDKISAADESRLFGPAGLDIGANQPEEIAISIIAEILSFIRNRKGASLRFRQQKIYTESVN